MRGLQTSINGGTPIRAALAGDGVLTVMAYIAHKPNHDGDAPRSHLEIGGLGEAGEERRWLHDPLRAGDEVRVVAAEFDAPDPWEAALPAPPASADAPRSIEISLNGELVERRPVESPGVALVLVTWSKGAATNPTPDEYVHLEVGTDVHTVLTPGDEVVIKALP